MQPINEKDKLAAQRRDMVLNQLQIRGIKDPELLKVMGSLHREDFIPAEFRDQSYADNPVPIGAGQTISQPYIVALMTQELKVNKYCDVLEIGTGSGYQTAILASLARHVYTIERIQRHSISAQQVLNALNISNISFHIGDGTCGWPTDKQFDRIIITAAAPDLPKPLADQLKIGGLAILPVGPELVQELVAMEKTPDGFKTRTICGCRFVKMIGKFGYTE
ncbi:MAG: protein-L-isoaspartate O-methyltransferase [Planctomycetes bacterium GWF2_41_51]|nr:MAG: protein-L-isoaspartate O-methyltransferase [Planctomycetes bacterium GWF2_41_51]